MTTGQVPRRRETDAQAQRRAERLREREAARVRLAEERDAAVSEFVLLQKARASVDEIDAAYRRAAAAAQAFNRGVAA